MTCSNEEKDRQRVGCVQKRGERREGKILLVKMEEEEEEVVVVTEGRNDG